MSGPVIDIASRRRPRPDAPPTTGDHALDQILRIVGACPDPTAATLRIIGGCAKFLAYLGVGPDDLVQFVVGEMAKEPEREADDDGPHAA